MSRQNLCGALLRLFIIAAVFSAFSAACSSGGVEADGDIEIVEVETCDIKCDPGCYIIDCECRCPGDGDSDMEMSENTDGDSSDGDTPDGDTSDNEEDSDIDFDYDNSDGDVDVPEFETDPELEESCTCDPADPYSCGDGYYCDGCRCQPESTDGDQTESSDSENIMCENGLPKCWGFDSENDVDMNIGHEACPPDAACDVESGCCTRDEVSCSNPIGCPDHWYCNTSSTYCDYECLNDNDCFRKYKRASLSCEGGMCVWIDGDAEEEAPPPCNSCEDCNGPGGQHPEGGYFCSSVTGMCEPQHTEDGCCEDSDCTVTGFACDPAHGQCVWNGATQNIGRISGTLTTSAALAGLTYVVKSYYIHETLGEVLESQSSNLSPQYTGGEYKVNYHLFQLSEGEKIVRISAIHLPGEESAYHSNPVSISYQSQDETYVDGINFFIGVPNPELGSISGTVKIDPAYDDDFIEVELLKMGSSGWLVQKTAELFPENQQGDLRYFAFTDLNPGSTHTSVSYYLRAVIYHGENTEYDYKPNPRVINLANPAQLHYENEKLFAGYEDSSFGSVVGSVHYPEFYSDGSFPKEVKLYADYQSKYEVGTARISNTGPNGFDYEIRNVEAKTYWLKYETEVYGQPVVALPGPSETVISVEMRQKDFDIDIYLDTPQPWVGSISGTISYTQDQLAQGMFYVQAYYNSSFTAPVFDRPETVLRYDVETETAQYFLDQLETGNYYIKAWLESPEGMILDEEILGGESTPTAVQVQAESPTPALKDVGGIDFDFTQP